MPNAVRYAWGSFAGSLITAEYALEQGKNIFAVPGRVGDACSEGCNALIAQGAGIAWNPEVLLEELFGSERKDPEAQSGKGSTWDSSRRTEKLSEEEKRVLQCLDASEQSMEAISSESGLEIRKTAAVLTVLCMDGLAVCRTPGYYCRSEEWD